MRTSTSTQIKSQAESTTLSHAIIEYLQTSILSGALAPGDRIRQEDIAEQFGTSRIPVREALKELAMGGLVTLIPNSGAWVSQVNPSECMEIYKIRACIEPLAIVESVPNMSDARISELVELMEEIELNTNVDDFLRLDRKFHLDSFADAGMPHLLEIIDRFWNATQHYRRAYFKMLGQDRHWIIYHEHRLIMDAIKRRDAAQAERMLRAHMGSSTTQLRESFEKGSLGATTRPKAPRSRSS